MKKTVKVILIGIIGFVLSASTAFAADPSFSGFLGDPSVYKQLTPGPKDGAKLRWIKPGVDFGKYNKFMVDSVIFYLAPDAYKGIDPQEMKELADSFNTEIMAAFRDKYPIVSEPGPDVARIRIAITNVKPSRPGVSAITSVVPVGIGISLIKKGATGGWSGSGETCVEFEALDSITNEAIVMAVDQQQAQFEDRFSKLGSAKDAFKFWAERIVKFLDEQKVNKM
ncbi:conserved exported hypothetical protein [uncultured Desulfobacterium sp.]|uniref:DUF3313 domain-containing protein n=1 Tax=uncultured Desulfobacterium sp. TaxID=201089 RepID=A0A445N1N5_9BACT|nr:conserved exported hypothetical protein [uncultured Desulfobacterium sp.]